MKNFVLLVLSMALISACGAKGSSSDSSSSDPATPEPAPGVTTDAPVALRIYSIYDKQTFVKYQTFEETGTSLCTATDTAPTPTCTIKVEEGRLYFSDLHFQFAWLPSKCKLFFFQPYYYLANTASAAFLPPWNDYNLVDCTASPLSSLCVGGAAPNAIDSFKYPEITGYVYTPDETDLSIPQTNEVKLHSSYARHYLSNRGAASDMAAGKNTSSYTQVQLGVTGDSYLANTFVPYTLSCRDDWYDPKPYIINLVITDVNSEGGDPGINNFWTWKELP
jgi:hypothetical protein